MLLKNKTVLLTGSNRGIGKSILTKFAENGADIYASMRLNDSKSNKYLDMLSKKFNVKIRPLYFDLNQKDQIIDQLKVINLNNDKIDILVNNAGIIKTSLFLMTSESDLKEVFDTNYFSQLILTQHVAKRMIKNKSGNIINISSSAGIEGNVGRLAYASSKAALICATKVIANELAAYNIRVNAIAPGLTDTDMMHESTAKESLDFTLSRTAMNRIGMPDEIADVALFLASNLSSYMTGQILRVDGGM